MATSWLASAIETAITEGKGLAVGKLGTCESDTLYLYNKQIPYNWVTRLQMTRNAGLWPDANKTLHDWSAYMAKHVLPQMDGVAMWWNEEHEGTVFRDYAPQAHIQGGIEWFEPWRWSEGHAWTRAIPAGCKVAVVTPFVESLTAQVTHVNKLFDQPIWQEPLPEFIPIKTGCSPIFDSTSEAAWPESIRSSGWLKAVTHIVKEVVASGARVAIVGCGALSLPIVAALKQRGIIAIHTGGVTQMIFGIRGLRWMEDPKFAHLCTGEYWTSPRPSETPLHATTIERGCYWVPPSSKSQS
jgi:hypothetical protein